LNTKGS